MHKLATSTLRSCETQIGRTFDIAGRSCYERRPRAGRHCAAAPNYTGQRQLYEPQVRRLYGAKWRRIRSTNAREESGCFVVLAQNFSRCEEAVIGGGSLAGAALFALGERE